MNYDTISKIKSLRAAGLSFRNIAGQLSLGRATVSAVVRGTYAQKAKPAELVRHEGAGAVTHGRPGWVSELIAAALAFYEQRKVPRVERWMSEADIEHATARQITIWRECLRLAEREAGIVREENGLENI